MLHPPLPSLPPPASSSCLHPPVLSCPVQIGHKSFDGREARRREEANRGVGGVGGGVSVALYPACKYKCVCVCVSRCVKDDVADDVDAVDCCWLLKASCSMPVGLMMDLLVWVEDSALWRSRMLPQWTRCWHLAHTNWTARRLTPKLHSLVEHIQRFAFINAL